MESRCDSRLDGGISNHFSSRTISRTSGAESLGALSQVRRRARCQSANGGTSRGRAIHLVTMLLILTQLAWITLKKCLADVMVSQVVADRGMLQIVVSATWPAAKSRYHD
jgi:hypothetical protein